MENRSALKPFLLSEPGVELPFKVALHSASVEGNKWRLLITDACHSATALFASNSASLCTSYPFCDLASAVGHFVLIEAALPLLLPNEPLLIIKRLSILDSTFPPTIDPQPTLARDSDFIASSTVIKNTLGYCSYSETLPLESRSFWMMNNAQLKDLASQLIAFEDEFLNDVPHILESMLPGEVCSNVSYLLNDLNTVEDLSSQTSVETVTTPPNRKRLCSDFVEVVSSKKSRRS
ncbi:hypothetical protein P9112_005620 [Eukaryota sp. TZLM1-RC]